MGLEQIHKREIDIPRRQHAIELGAAREGVTTAEEFHEQLEGTRRELEVVGPPVLAWRSISRLGGRIIASRVEKSRARPPLGRKPSRRYDDLV